MPIMHEEIKASSELYDAFPRYTMSDYGSIPNIVVPSKYSSTETEYSSDEDDSGGGDNVRKIGSGFSTSASSSGSGKRRRRKRKGSSSGSTGVGWQTNSFTSIKSNMSRMSNQSSLSHGSGDRKRNLSVPVLNSINDLNHAIGRHRGISGSFNPAIDSVLFAMFYVSDTFDGVLTDEMTLMRYQNRRNSYTLKKDIISILRKEIVYSLRTSYFCPASKIVKLAQLLEDNFPLERFHDPAGFLDLLLSKILNAHHPPFFKYSDGSTGNIHRLHVEEERHLQRRYFQPSSYTIQDLLQRNLGTSSRRYSLGDSNDGKLQFMTVPYPALILQVDRRFLNETDESNQPGWIPQPNLPIIPNMEVELTGLISKNNGRLHRQVDGLQQSFNSCMSESYNSNYPTSEHSFSYEQDVKGQETASESRFAKGLKSAWKVMFKYLENFASSSDLIAHHRESVTLSENGGSNNVTPNSYSSKQNNEYSYNSHGKNNHLRTSSLLTSSLKYNKPSELQESRFKEFSQQHQPQVKMELIAIICYADSRSGNIRTKKGSLPSYFVYCKAGKDKKEENGINGYENADEFAPWVLYQSRYGVAPQVTLIENFGKWISSLERNHGRFSLYEVPFEVRRVLENSHLLIYKRSS